MSNIAKNNNLNVDKPVDSTEKTPKKDKIKVIGKNLTQIIISGLVATGMAILHEYATQEQICEVLKAEPEIAGVFGGAIRAFLLKAGNTA